MIKYTLANLMICHDTHSPFSGLFPTSFLDWKLIDKIEKSMVQGDGAKPREKILSFEEMIRIIKESGGGWLKT